MTLTSTPQASAIAIAGKRKRKQHDAAGEFISLWADETGKDRKKGDPSHGP